jgi:2-isopropylmalate synthase
MRIPTINCPDTIGGACDFEGEDYFVTKMSRHAEIIASEFPDADVVWSTHCHNDFGLAVQNSINAVFKGPATQIEGCFNGVGERAGNAALEQCIMVIKQFAETVDSENPYYTQIETEHLQTVSDFVDKHMLPRQPHWPINGENAARHSSGGHTNAILKNPLAYQPFDPAEVGKQISLVFGPLSGGNHAKAIIEDNGYICTNAEKTKIAQFIKEIYKDRRKGVTNVELMDAYFLFRSPIVVDEIDYWRSKNTSEVQIVGKFFDQEGEIRGSYEGKDSSLTSLKELIDKHYPGITIEHYSSESVGSGVHAVGRSTIIAAHQETGEQFTGIADDQDIGKSAMKALIAAVNKAYIARHYTQPEG